MTMRFRSLRVPCLVALAGAGLAVALGTTQTPAGSCLRKLKIVIETTEKHDAGTNANIYLAATWRLIDESSGGTFQVPTRTSDMESGRTDTYRVEIPETDRLYQIPLEALGPFVLINGMNGDRPGWHVRAVHIFGYADDGHTYVLADANVDRWLDTKAQTGSATVIPLKTPVRDLGATDDVGPTTSPLKPIERWPAE